ncbi:hypothetical protein [Kribbella italica]|uniref:Uncharacterized protein n=1 Tax=Kribbella italica TaxID=1540520 RepID=A0A7W9JCK1_9ACTN|nr:hypothetical protein [Kribbella italica]MBB5839662.1 hypothetical protein [Kribbella italica]
MRNNRALRIGTIAIAAAAVAGVGIAGAAIARTGQSTAVAGGGPGATPSTSPSESATPSTGPSEGATPSSGATPSASPGTPSAVPSGATPSVWAPSPPGRPTVSPSDPATPSTVPGQGHTVTRIRPSAPPRPKEYPLPKDAVAACKALLAGADQNHPGRTAKPVARLDGGPGSIVVLADASHWAACDTAYARHNEKGSLRAPARIAKPSARDTAAFAVAANIVPRNGKDYQYYWAAGLVPRGVAKIAYTFPDGTTEKAVVQGNYWLVQHQDARPWTPGSDAGAKEIAVKLTAANGSVVRTFTLDWGTHTCAQITHGC